MLVALGCVEAGGANPFWIALPLPTRHDVELDSAEPPPGGDRARRYSWRRAAFSFQILKIQSVIKNMMFRFVHTRELSL